MNLHRPCVRVADAASRAATAPGRSPGGVWKAVSSITGTPDASALRSLDAPGSAPTTSAVVRPDTEPGAEPPLARMACLASSRLKLSRAPLTTTDMPARVWGSPSPSAAPSDASASIRSPAFLRPSMSRRLCASSNQARTDAAMIGPNPSTSARASSPASRMPSTSPKDAASTWALTWPISGMLNANSSLDRGCSLLASIDRRRLFTEI